MPFYAHTQGPDKKDWEPLFTPFGETTDDPTNFCSGQNATSCPHCENLDPKHGHLNKVAHLAAKFAAEMFPPGPNQDSAKQWGYLAGAGANRCIHFNHPSNRSCHPFFSH